jgi:photosystem II stability/assembly factor-like uncharacterized protein
VKDSFVFAGSIEEGVFRSSDNGETWAQKLSAFGMGPMCLSGNTIFASSSNYTFGSTDNGESWFYVSDLEGAAIFSYYCKDSLIIAGGRNRIYKSTDYGSSFIPIDLNFSFGIVNISSVTAVGSTLFMATSYDGVYKSTDDGFTWTPANRGMGPKDARAIAVSNSSTLIAGTHYVGMYRSTDLGLSWNKSVTGFPAGSSILSLIVNDISVFAGTRDGVYRTDDNGDNWVRLGGASDTTNYGTAWAMCEDDGTIYASLTLYFDAAVYKSKDNGANWIRCGEAGLPSDISFIKGLVSSGENIVTGTDEGIYYSSNGGASWFPTNLLNLNIPSLATSGNYAYAAVPSGFGVYRSVNNGVTWTLSLQSTIDYVEVAALDNYVFAGAFFGGARYSTNYGTTWSASSGFPPDASVFALGPVGDGMVLAGTDLGPSWTYASLDNGISYSPYSEGLGERASVEAFAVNGTYMFAGTDHNGVWRRLRPGAVGIDVARNVPEAFNLTQNFPNPFNPSTTIQFTLPETGEASLKIYDVRGHEIRTLLNGTQPAGTRSVIWDGRNHHGELVSSGTYFCRLESGNSVVTRKMMYLR